MIRINSFLHRDLLYHMIRRWMFDDLQPGDVDEILRLVHFNNVYVSRYLDRFATMLFTGLYGGGLRTEQVSTKGALRDRISTHLPVADPRCEEMIAAYRRSPGRYFRETPYHGSLYFRDDRGTARYIGSSRIKRIRRLAEKTARRLVDWLHEMPGAQPAAGAVRQDAVDADPGEAEQRLLDQLHGQHVLPQPDSMTINDVAGIKVILEAHEFERLLALLAAADCNLVEQERHDGVYRATNLVIDYRPERDSVLHAPLHERMLEVFAAHGYSAARANAAFREFVLSGEDSVRVEIIVTSYAELLESEIGRCMHEERIIRQRHNPRYYGQLAQNVGFLMEFLFTYPALPYRRLERLPVSIRNRYLPDYFDEVRRRLFGNPSVELDEL